MNGVCRARKLIRDALRFEFKEELARLKAA